jgi:hypothetical protein
MSAVIDRRYRKMRRESILQTNVKSSADLKLARFSTRSPLRARSGGCRIADPIGSIHRFPQILEGNTAVTIRHQIAATGQPRIGSLRQGRRTAAWLQRLGGDRPPLQQNSMERGIKNNLRESA